MEWESFVPPFFGVLAAFVLQWAAKSYERSKDREQFLHEIKKELESCSKLLTGAGQLLPIDIWDYGKASDLLRLIPREARTQLAGLYYGIQCYNYEATKVRDVSILAATKTCESSGKTLDDIVAGKDKVSLKKLKAST
jgi:hypothetical protein